MKNNNLGAFSFFLTVYTIIVFLSNDAYLPALPEIMKDFGVSTHAVQATVTAWFLGSASVQLVLGPLSDRFGRRPVLLIGGIFFVISSAVCALTGELSVFIIARVAQGAAVTSMIVAGYAAVNEAYEQEKAIKVLAKINGVTVLAPALGPLFGALILYVGSWSLIFMVLAVSAILVLLALFFKMPETNVEKHPLHLVTLFKHYKKIISNRLFLKYIIPYGALFGGFIAWITVSPLLIIDVYHFSAIQFGLIQGAVFVCFTVGSLLLARLASKLSVHKLIDIALLLALLALVVVTLGVIFISQSFWIVLFGVMSYSLASGLSYAALNRLAIDACDEPMGLRVAISSMVVCVSGVIGSGLISHFFEGSVLTVLLILLFAAVISIMSYHLLAEK